MLGPAEKLAGGRARRVGAAPTDRAPRLGPSARGQPRRAAPRAHVARPHTEAAKMHTEAAKMHTEAALCKFAKKIRVTQWISGDTG